MNVNEPMDFEPAEVINDLPPDQGGLRPMPAGSVAAEVVEVQAAVEQDPDDAIEDARDDRGRFQRGRRAPSHDARPDDAPRISKLSADLRETRVELALERGLRDVDAILDRVYPKATADERQKQRKHVEAQVAAYRPIAPKVDTAPVAMPAALPPAASPIRIRRTSGRLGAGMRRKKRLNKRAPRRRQNARRPRRSRKGNWPRLASGGMRA
jgi:hypothetical protein